MTWPIGEALQRLAWLLINHVAVVFVATEGAHPQPTGVLLSSSSRLGPDDATQPRPFILLLLLVVYNYDLHSESALMAGFEERCQRLR